ncbi:FtsX-like permease family protein [Planococcus sp. CAU13]|uniref:FtsX-like permease family protein n=1 Tax=Planococcus sp. CAU13 TaxID=1541197 RepID=UPI00052FF8D8|nr:FtsX-like permease family protein [Planococcus sp. CAU13]
MIKSLQGLAFRFFRENKFIAVSSILGVAISISLILTMALFVSNAKQSLMDEVQQMFGTMDLAVGYNPEQGKIIDPALANQLTAFDAVEESSSVLLSRLYIEQLENTIYTIGAENDALAKSRYHFSEDLAQDDVILNRRLAEALQVQAGDKLMLENREYTVKEVTADLEAAGPVTDTLILAKSRVQLLEYEKTDIYQEATYILMKAKEDDRILELAQGLKSVDSELRVDIATEDEFVRANLDLLNQFIIVLAVLVLVLTSLFIISNFEVFLYKYKNQLAIMRALGASTKQIFTVVFLQSGLINILGAVTSFFLVLGSHQFIQSWLGPLLNISITRNAFNFGLAFLIIGISFAIIQVFMLIPAYRSSKVLPLTIMQENETIHLPYQRVRTLFGLGLMTVSIAFITFGFFFAHLVLLLLLGAVFLVLSMFLLLPIFITPFLTGLLPAIKSVFGNISFITVKNLIPQIRKNILVVLIISAMMVIAVFGSTFIQTISQSDEEYVKRQFLTEILITSSVGGEQAVSQEELQQAVNRLPAIESISTLSGLHGHTMYFNDQTVSVDYAYADLEAMQEQQLIPALHTTNGFQAVISEEAAELYGLTVGAEVRIEQFYESTESAFTISAIAKELPHWADVLIDWNATMEDPELSVAFVQPVDEDVLYAAGEIQNLFPMLTVSSFEQSLEQSQQMSFQRSSIFLVVLAVILFSVMLGVVNTLINNIHSRRKEYAVLRAISLSPKGIIQAVLTQVAVYLVIGVVFGSVAGFALTYVLSLVDGTPLRFDFQLVAALLGVIITASLLVFIPFANKIGKMTISTELMQDNK